MNGLLMDGEQPLVVYRGQHGIVAPESPFQSRLGALSFGSRQAAEIYAREPNNREDAPLQPHVIKAHLRIENPFVNDPEDPFLDLSKLVNALGREYATEVALRKANYITHTNNWCDELGLEYPDVETFLREHPEDGLEKLYADTYCFLDDAEVITRLREAGFDGAIHAGTGENAMEPEYKVFTPEQVIVLAIERLQPTPPAWAVVRKKVMAP